MSSASRSAAAGDQQSAQEESVELQSTADMTKFVQTLLTQMQTKFQGMSENIVSKIDEMGVRIDELERSINDLKAEMGAETPTKANLEEPNPPSDLP